ncbi:MAG: glycoside hydrolase family 3 C-terminal domain-containing protein, partial [Oscillospiraceae bacterium]|nr:glycoside hydrolase family 3 C-terminal domain-containing protein [Oscillospiraceae bacterium]
AESLALSLKAGTDCFTDNAELVKASAAEALERGLIGEGDIDTAVLRSLRIRFRLGHFDPDSASPYTVKPLCSEEHTETALEAARKGVVLLDNDGILPLCPESCGKALVIGDLAERNLPDWYSGKPPFAVTPLTAIRKFVPDAGHMTAHDLCVLVHDELGYLCAGPDGAVSWEAENRTVFEEVDWGFSTVTYRNIQTGKYLKLNHDGSLSCDSDMVWGWFTYERFSRDEETGRFLPHADTFNDGMGGEGKAAANTLLASLTRQVLTDGIAKVVDAAARSGVVILTLGNHPLLNGRECFDRPSIAFPKRWKTLIRRLREVNKNLILTLIAGYPYAFPDEVKYFRAVLYTAHGEQHVGTAVAETLFGKNNPAGRLPMTWVESETDLPEINDYDLINRPRTYQYFGKPVRYPFGYGLSYTTFSYTGLTAEPDSGGFRLTCAVRNTGPSPGDEVVQLYVAFHGVLTVFGKPERLPRRTLCGFARISLQPGELKSVDFSVPREDLAFFSEEESTFIMPPGRYTFSVGASSEDIRSTADVEILGGAKR